MQMTGDPEGVMATLQVARRLVAEKQYSATDALKKAADEFAAAKDPARAFWRALYVLGKASPVPAAQLDARDVDKVVPWFDAAIALQGAENNSRR